MEGKTIHKGGLCISIDSLAGMTKESFCAKYKGRVKDAGKLWQDHIKKHVPKKPKKEANEPRNAKKKKASS